MTLQVLFMTLYNLLTINLQKPRLVAWQLRKQTLLFIRQLPKRKKRS